MASINDIAERLRDLISETTGVPCTPIVDQPNPPCVMVYPDDMARDAYYEAFQRGVVTIPMVVHVLVSSQLLEGQQEFLNDLVSPFGPRSIPQAIHQNPTLGTGASEALASSSATMSAKVGQLDSYGLVETPAGQRFLQAKLRVSVQTRGDR